MKVLIAGASGALGVPLTRVLVSAGHQVVGLTRTPANRSRLAELGAEPVVADAMDRAGLLAALRGTRADAVVHALTALRRPPARYRDMAATNALRDQGTANLLAAAEVVGAHRFVAESMHLGYGYGDWGDRVLTEDQQWAPPGRTAGLERTLAAFRALEHQVFDATARGRVEGISLRFGAFYGPGAGLETFVDLLRARRMPLPGGGRRVLSWIHITDAATAVLAALERGRPGQAYNVVDDEPVCWRDFAATLATAFGTPRPWPAPMWVMRLTVPYLAAFLGDTTLRASAGRARAELGWVPSVPDYRAGIGRAARDRGGVTP